MTRGAAIATPRVILNHNRGTRLSLFSPLKTARETAPVS